MPVQPSDIERARAPSVEAGATRVLLFGSASEDPSQAHDLDLACEGILPGRFFHVYGSLLLELPVAADPVELSDRTASTRYVEGVGKLLYEKK